MNRTVYSFVPALDLTSLDQTEHLVAAIGRHPKISGFKVGFSLGLTYGLPQVTAMIRKHSDRPIIYDHQKAATDIPDTGALFARTMKESGIDEVILFPMAGPRTLEAWVKAMRDQGRKVIIGGLMTHPGYIAAEGGFLREEAPREIYTQAVELGVTAFVVPLTRPELVQELLRGVPFKPGTEFYSPGFGRQGGSPAGFGGIARHHLIVGRSLLEAKDPASWLEQNAPA